MGEPPAVASARASKRLPATPPSGLGPKVWLAAQEVHALTREAGEDSKWSDLEFLLNMVRRRIRDQRLSKWTLNDALAYLRDNRLINR